MQFDVHKSQGLPLNINIATHCNEPTHMQMLAFMAGATHKTNQLLDKVGNWLTCS